MYDIRRQAEPERLKVQELEELNIGQQDTFQPRVTTMGAQTEFTTASIPATPVRSVSLFADSR
jgi:hypothetical protein